MLGDPLARVWLRRLNPAVVSLVHLYAPGKERLATYDDVVRAVLTAVREGKTVCMVTTGHPGVFSYAQHTMIRQARAEGYDARMFPGISAEDCLFADLGVDPGAGLQTYEATYFLRAQEPFDEHSALVLYQIGAIAESSCKPTAEAWNPSGIELLGEVLGQTYGDSHEVVVYEAARYAFLQPAIQRFPLAQLADARVTVLSTLYVPRKSPRPSSEAMVRRLLAHR